MFVKATSLYSSEASVHACSSICFKNPSRKHNLKTFQCSVCNTGYIVQIMLYSSEIPALSNLRMLCCVLAIAVNHFSDKTDENIWKVCLVD